MSIVVDLDQLAERLAEHGPGYLLSAGPDGRVKAVTVEPVLDGEVLRVPGGSRGTARNLEHSPAVTVLFPPSQPRGYSLIVDGTATATADGFDVVPEHAVLHRPADHAGPAAAGDSACGHDCSPLDVDGQP
jgi:hypothetical protein